MKLEIDQIKENGYSVGDTFADNVTVIKDFAQKRDCMRAVLQASSLMRNLPHRRESEGVFYSIDVFPQGVNTDRIFRTLQINEPKERILGKEIIHIFSKMQEFQDKFIVNEKNIKKDQSRRFQIIHYPKGGGYFDWHEHPRYPVNYGLILNLSEKGVNFEEGATEIITDEGEKVTVEKISNIGDLILFRYDLKHRVAPCDSDDDLVFDKNGRWTAIMPIF